MSRTQHQQSSGKRATLGTIFISVLSVAGIALSGLIDSPAKGIALVLTGLALAAVVARVLTIWNGHIDRLLIGLLAVFLVPFGLLVSLLYSDLIGEDGTISSDSRAAQLEKRISELEQEKAALEAQVRSLSSTTSSPEATSTSVTPGRRPTTSTQTSTDGTDFDLTLKSGWGADLDIGRAVRPPEAEGSDIYNDGWLNGRDNDVIAFSHQPSREECRAAIKEDRGNPNYSFDEITEGTSFCLLTDKERIALLKVVRLGHDAQTDSEYAVFRVTLLK
jgi:hypothetical protein